MRGNRAQAGACRVASGSIPACAGEPLRLVAELRPFGVYPRVCGGTRGRRRRYQRGGGLSPRVRGNPWVDHERGWTPGSIPACAGEPRRSAPSAARCAVYPRVCGGTYAHGRGRMPDEGLSPRVRGNRQALGRALRRLRSIPACAGEPSGQHTLGVDAGVYPRVCGGTRPDAGCRPAAGGLSPRVRGNRCQPVDPYF